MYGHASNDFFKIWLADILEILEDKINVYANMVEIQTKTLLRVPQKM